MNKLNTQGNIPLFIAARIENRYDYDRELWVTLPITKEQFAHAVSTICDSEDEFVIRGYYTTVPGFLSCKLMSMPFSTINFIAARLKKLTDEQVLKLMMIMESDFDFRTAEQIIDFTYRPDKYELLPGISTFWLLGAQRKNELDMKTLPPALIDCIDTTAFGISSTLHDDGKFTPLGYLSLKSGQSKSFKKRSIPAYLDIKEKDGEEIFGKWFCDDDFEPFDSENCGDEESGDDV